MSVLFSSFSLHFTSLLLPSALFSADDYVNFERCRNIQGPILFVTLANIILSVGSGKLKAHPMHEEFLGTLAALLSSKFHSWLYLGLLRLVICPVSTLGLFSANCHNELLEVPQSQGLGNSTEGMVSMERGMDLARIEKSRSSRVVLLIVWPLEALGYIFVNYYGLAITVFVR